MKRFLITAVLAIVASLAAPAGATDVGVSISVGQPGFYGRLDIGDFPRPQLIHVEPVVVHAPPAGVIYEPLYLHVPPGHAKHWHKHCARYGACGRPVYFVRERWYNDVYVPRYRERHVQHRVVHEHRVIHENRAPHREHHVRHDRHEHRAPHHRSERHGHRDGGHGKHDKGHRGHGKD